MLAMGETGDLGRFANAITIPAERLLASSRSVQADHFANRYEAGDDHVLEASHIPSHHRDLANGATLCSVVAASD